MRLELDGSGSLFCLLIIFPCSSISLAVLKDDTCLLLNSESWLSGVLPLPTAEAASSDIPVTDAGALGLPGMPGSSMPGTNWKVGLVT